LPLLIQNDVIKKNRIGIVPHFTNLSYFRNTGPCCMNRPTA
jgi:hypothetical protein